MVNMYCYSLIDNQQVNHGDQINFKWNMFYQNDLFFKIICMKNLIFFFF